MPGKGGRFGVVGGQGLEDAFGGLARAAVGGGKEVEGVGGAEEGAQFVPCGEGLCPSFRGEFDSVVGGCLVDFTVFVTLGLSMPYKDYHLGSSVSDVVVRR